MTDSHQPSRPDSFKLTRVSENGGQVDWLTAEEMKDSLQTISQLLPVLQVGETFTIERISK